MAWHRGEESLRCILYTQIGTYSNFIFRFVESSGLAPDLAYLVWDNYCFHCIGHRYWNFCWTIQLVLAKLEMGTYSIPMIVRMFVQLIATRSAALIRDMYFRDSGITSHG